METDKIQVILSEDIDNLEKQVEKLKVKINTLTKDFSLSDMNKLEKYVKEVNNINYTIRHLLILKGSLNHRIKN